MLPHSATKFILAQQQRGIRNSKMSLNNIFLEVVRNHRMVRSKAQTSEPGGQRTHYNKCAHPTCSSSLISIQIFDIHTTEPEQLAQQVLHWVVNYTTTNFYSPQTLSLLGCPALRADDPAPRYCKARAEGERNRWKKKKKKEESNGGDALDVNRRHRPRSSDDDWRKKKRRA